MKRILYPLICLSFSLLACSIQATVTPTQPPVVTEPPADVTEPPQPTEPPLLPNTICNELSFSWILRWLPVTPVKPSLKVRR